MIDDGPFTLTNRPAKPARRKAVAENVCTTQPLLFLGSHTDLPDQQDLFDPNQFIRTVVPQPTSAKCGRPTLSPDDLIRPCILPPGHAGHCDTGR